jgi:transposase-like protein
MSERAVPFHCPYCGDEDLRPHGDERGGSPHGAWECRACLRAFSLKLLGLVRPQAAAPEAAS